LLHALSEQFDLARAEFERAIKLAPASDLPLAAVELANIQQNRVGDAIQDLRKKAKQKGDGAMLWYLLGKALMLNGAQAESADSAEAISAFEKAIRFDPKLAYPYVELGKIYMQLGRTQDAVPLFEKALALAPRRQSSYYQLALAYRKLNRPEQACQMLERLKELNRHDREFQQSELVER
jgi:tetratricopeptide (TPR) repeat protein